MKSIIISLMLIASLYSCAGMDHQHQSNMTSNAGLWGLIGAATGAGIAAATGGNPGKAAILGGIGGAYLGAANTPTARDSRYDLYYEQNCGSFYTYSEINACERGRAQRQRTIQRERERRAYQYGYYGY